MDFIKNPQTTIALTFMTRLISGIDGVKVFFTAVLDENKKYCFRMDSN